MENPFMRLDNSLNLLAERVANVESILLSATSKGGRLAPNDDPQQLINKKEAAALLSVSTATVDNYARAGYLQRHYVGRVVRFKRHEVVNLANSKKGSF